jgi:hypothetical protein
VDAVQDVLPVLEITSGDALAIRQGKRISGPLDTVTALVCDQELVAVAESAGNQSIKSVVVFSDGESSV